MNLLKTKFYIKNNGIDLGMLFTFLASFAMCIIIMISFFTNQIDKSRIYEFVILYAISFAIDISLIVIFIDDVKSYYNSYVYYNSVNLKIRRNKNYFISLDEVKYIIEKYDGCDKND